MIQAVLYGARHQSRDNDVLVQLFVQVPVARHSMLSSPVFVAFSFLFGDPGHGLSSY